MQQPPIKILNRNAALGSEEGGKPAQASESIEQSTGCRRLFQTPDDGNRIGNHFKYAQRGKNQIKPTDNRHHQIERFIPPSVVSRVGSFIGYRNFLITRWTSHIDELAIGDVRRWPVGIGHCEEAERIRKDRGNYTTQGLQ